MSAGLLESAQNLLAGLLDLGRTRFELFGTELREELARLATALLGGLAVLVLGALGLAFVGLCIIFYVSEANRVMAAGACAASFLVVAGILAWQLRRAAGVKPRAFDATLSELQRDLTAIKQ
jgi:uncharacterized membrane protein YqjE